MMFAASTMLVSGATEMTDRVMIWWARMENSAGFRISMRKPSSVAGVRFDSGQANQAVLSRSNNCDPRPDLMQLNAHRKCRHILLLAGTEACRDIEP
jgi:hypothetical protein